MAIPVIDEPRANRLLDLASLSGGADPIAPAGRDEIAAAGASGDSTVGDSTSGTDTSAFAAPADGTVFADAGHEPAPMALAATVAPMAAGGDAGASPAPAAAATLTLNTAAASASVAAAQAPAATDAAPALEAGGTAVAGTTATATVTSGTATRGVAGLSTGGVSLTGTSVVAKAGQSVALSSLFKVTASASNPTYLILDGLDRDEYTKGFSTSTMGSLKGATGAVDKISAFNLAQTGDAYTAGIVFTYQASTGRYYNSSYGYFDQMTYTASTTTNDNTSLSVYTTNNAGYATTYAANPYVLSQNPQAFGYVGSVSIVTQPTAAQPAGNATPGSIVSVADSFVGKAWNENGCWVLASTISAEAGASLPLTSTSVGIAGTANGEWVVAYNGPVGANSNWEASLTAGEMVDFVTTSGGGHITTVVSGSGASALLVDNITYVNANGSIANSANDGSASDVLIAAPHAASQEFTGVNASMVVVYELDTPVVSDTVSSLTVSEKTSQALAPLFSAVNPLAGQTVTGWQVYDTNGNDTITVNGVAQTADHSAAAAVTVSSLSGVSLLAGAVAGSDTIEVRAYNGSYWGDWQSLTASISPSAAPPLVTSQTANQTWTQKSSVSFSLPANTFTDPQGQALTYSATLSTGQALPSWLSFNAKTDTFSGVVPAGAQSFSIKVTATDTSGLSASETFGVTVPTLAPIVANQTASQTWTDGSKISFSLPANTFSDPQGQALSYTAYQVLTPGSPLATSWLGFNVTTDTFTGTVPGSAAGTLTLEVVAKNTSGLTATDLFNVTLKAAGSSGTVAGATVALVPPQSTGLGQLAASS